MRLITYKFDHTLTFLKHTTLSRKKSLNEGRQTNTRQKNKIIFFPPQPITANFWIKILKNLNFAFIFFCRFFLLKSFDCDFTGLYAPPQFSLNLNFTQTLLSLFYCEKLNRKVAREISFLVLNFSFSFFPERIYYIESEVNLSSLSQLEKNENIFFSLLSPSFSKT